MPVSADDDVVDLRGIADLLVVSRTTPSVWRQRGVLPDPDFPELQRPLWKRDTIITWARNSGRWPKDKPTDQEVAAVVGAVAKLFQDKDAPNRGPGFKTKEDYRNEIPQVVFRQPDLKHVAHVRIEELPREKIVYQLTDLEPEEDEVHQAPEAEEDNEETKTAEVVVLSTEIDDEPIPAAEDAPICASSRPPMEPVVIKGYGATLAFDGEYIIVEHAMAGAVRARVDQILGVDLKEPRGLIAGRLRISTARYQYRGCRTWRPWTFCFGRQQADAVRDLFIRLMQRPQQ